MHIMYNIYAVPHKVHLYAKEHINAHYIRSTVYHRYFPEGLCAKDGDKMKLTQAGRTHLEKSQPYTGNNSEVINNGQMRII